ncbi:phage portal protein [Roseobacter weihaiensis]|uniref:phage portal protein n=1 Tax=Roseobacter weihaiensis TaxID=2763262 RepID=UPI001D09FB86|nr:phage portal protein [Roseobacter sp. H9]
MKLPFFGRQPAAVPETSTRVEPVVAQRSYRAAYSHRLAKGFTTMGAKTPREETAREIRGLVGHSRHAAHNFDHARAYEMLVRRHVIGQNGIRLQMRITDPDGRPDKLANEKIEAGWKKWGRKGSPSICGRLSFWGIECQIATAIAREGGAFVRLHRGRKGGPFGLRLEPILFDLLDLDLTQPMAGGGYIESGIEFDEDGRPLAFHIWETSPGSSHMGTRHRRRIPAADMVQILIPEEIGQSLGIPRSATALRLMNMADAFQKAGMEAAHFGAAAMLFFKRNADSSVLSGTDDTADDGGPPIDRIEAGTILNLPPGVEPVRPDSHYPDAAVEPFMRNMNASTAAGLGVSRETLTGDLTGANFSSLRAGKGEERDEWRMLQRAFFESFHDVVFQAWLETALLTQAIGLPIEKIDKFDAAEWRPRGWPSVNPKDDATAAEKDLALGLRSRREIAAERGRDIEEVDKEIAEDKERAERLKLNLGSSPPKPPGPAPNQEDSDP